MTPAEARIVFDPQFDGQRVIVLREVLQVGVHIPQEDVDALLDTDGHAEVSGGTLPVHGYARAGVRPAWIEQKAGLGDRPCRSTDIAHDAAHLFRRSVHEAFADSTGGEPRRVALPISGLDRFLAQQASVPADDVQMEAA